METRLRQEHAALVCEHLLLRGPVVPQGARRGSSCRSDGFVATGLRAEIDDDGATRACASRAIPSSSSWRLRHCRERARRALSGLPGISRRRLFRAARPPGRRSHLRRRGAEAREPVALDALTRFSRMRRIAPYKFPDAARGVTVPRDAHGRVLRAGSCSRCSSHSASARERIPAEAVSSSAISGIVANVAPIGVHALDQPNLPRPFPFLDLFLARNRTKHCLVHFHIDE